ncbi:MAG: ABC transporter substrate-binding protein [Candidatus Marinimicrobia bacterium]|nr:ABC transporter substrate-binding protein [Candidatus Neomarinimicrobiota bacterium]
MKRAVILLVVLLGFFCVKSRAGNQKPVVLQVQWFPQAQFAGYLMAKEKGLFQVEGIDVEVRFSDEHTSPITELLEGRADFCTAWISQTLTLGKPIVNICQVLQKSSLMLVAKKESGILKPEDMNGKTIAIWGGDFSIQPYAFFRKFNIKPNLVPQAYNIDAFLVGAYDVASAMYYNEFNKFYLSGIDQDELVQFFYSDYGLNFPEDGIYCTSLTYEKKPELCRKMRRGILKGWEYAFDHEEETLDILMEYCEKFHVRTNRAHQKWMLNAIKEAVVYQVGDDPTKWGVLKKDDFLRVAEELKQQGFIRTVPQYENFYKE